jgi:hypothetical protein
VVFYVLINSAFVGGDNLYLSKCMVEQQFKKKKGKYIVQLSKYELHNNAVSIFHLA